MKNLIPKNEIIYKLANPMIICVNRKIYSFLKMNRYRKDIKESKVGQLANKHRGDVAKII